VLDVSDLPAVNACLNATSGVLLVVGFGFIRQGRVTAHKSCMLAAFVVSVVFLASYLVYHYQSGHKVYDGSPMARGGYLAILSSHVVLAVAVPPLALTTIYRGFRQQWDRHRRIAKWTLPIWLYVSVTGVVVYLMLYG